jgi:acetyl-CoA acetyltransferase
MTAFGRHEGTAIEELGREAIEAALTQSGLPLSEIDIIFCGHSLQGITAGQRVVSRVGSSGAPIINVENACASGSTAFAQAVMAVRGGMARAALAVGFEKMDRGPIAAAKRLDTGAAERPKGGPPVMPAMFAEVFKEHSLKYGTTVRQMAMVSAKNHGYAALNPKAHHRDEIGVEEVLNSRMIAEPLTLLMCCPTSTGAAAAVVTGADLARAGSKEPIEVAASVLQSERASAAGALHFVTEINTRAAKLAYSEAGIGPDRLDVVELHDCFAIAEICHYENLGLCERGEGGKFIEAGLSRIGGKTAVSTSGGLLAKGHPLGATGVAQVAEIVEQLRGESDRRQVPGAKIGLSHCQGFGGAVTVHIFSKTRTKGASAA